MITLIILCLLVYTAPYIAIAIFIIGLIYGLLDN